MAFELKRREPVPSGVRRVVGKQIDRALAVFQNGHGAPTDAAVHDVRNRFKEIRAVLRLLRGELGKKTFERENRAFRSAGRPLSMVRDAKVQIDSLDKLIEHFNGRISVPQLAALRHELLDRRRAARKEALERDPAVAGIVKTLHAARDRLKDWPLERRGWKAIEPGLRKVYAQGRRAMKRVRAEPTDLALHEWRKRAKDLRYQLELLAPVRRAKIAPLARQAHDLSDLLGDDHDLAVLKTLVNVRSLDDLIAERRAELQKKSLTTGEQLYAERPRDFIRMIGRHWKRAISPA